MAGKVKLINFGGTLLMRDDPARGKIPAYDLDEMFEGGVESIGFDAKPHVLSYAPLDSINFDVDTHYAELRKAVIDTLRAGDVPVIAGGTDTLRYYDTLLAEDMSHLRKSGMIKQLPPIILATSMHTFDKKPDHVRAILKNARAAAGYGITLQQEGVFAMRTEDEAVSKVTLMSMEVPFDKISGTLVKSFVGADTYVIDEARIKSDASIFSKGDAFGKGFLFYHGDKNVAAEIPEYRHALMAPPLESYNSASAINHYLYAAFQQGTAFPFRGIVLHGLPAKITDREMDGMKAAIAALAEKHIHVFVTDCFQGDMSGELTNTTNYRNTQLKTELEKAGAIFPNHTTSTQAHIRASMCDEKGAPLYYVDARKQAETNAAQYRASEKGRITENVAAAWFPPAEKPKAMAIEYVPDAPAYASMLDVLDHMGIKTVISVNCSDGAMAEAHEATLKKHPKMKFIATFKYAGIRYREEFNGKEFVESATLSEYAPSVKLKGILEPGGMETPQVLLQRELGRGR